MNYKKMFNIPENFNKIEHIDTINLYMARPIAHGIYNPNIICPFKDINFYSCNELKLILKTIFNFNSWQIKIRNNYLYVCFLDFNYWNRGKDFSFILEEFLNIKNYKIVDKCMLGEWNILKCSSMSN